ncbi:hypothetical protein BDQ17DRAFT_1347688 [Cyathus striatus]|nr:hypothetical protein BDQ17DRAFT_1347688 [Cyathus striatus]
MLLDLILETHAWSAARPKHESQAAVQRFEAKISAVIDVENEQGTFASPLPLPLPAPPSCLCSTPSRWASHLFGRPPPKIPHSRHPVSTPSLANTLATEKTRQRLAQFVVQMKTALATLSALAP